MPGKALPHPEERPQGASRRTHGDVAPASPIILEWLRWAELTAPLLHELLRFRQAIFVVEQASPYPDLDGRDPRSEHLLVRRGAELLGCLRLIEPDPLVRIG